MGGQPSRMSSLEVLRVLVADDNLHMRAIVTAVLKSLGIRMIKQANDGAQALAILHQWQADLAVVDFRMEPIDGVEFTRLVRQSEHSPNIYLPIIMLTGHSEESRVASARDTGVDEFLVKPLNVTGLMARLNAVVYRRRPFIRTEGYFGPDRRRQRAPFHTGPWRRHDDSKPD